MARGPVLIEMEGESPSVADAPMIDEDAASGAAMRGAARVMARRRSWLARWFLRLAGVLVATLASIAAWDFATSLLQRMPVLGLAVSILMAAVALLALLLALREVAVLGRLAKVDALRRAADAARAGEDLAAARTVSARLAALYATRAETAEGRSRLERLGTDQMDAESLMALTEDSLVLPLDALARREVEAAARQVATVTALVPLALADVAAALVANLRMIRRIAEIYGGRSGVIGGWRLTRAVMAHLVATGAVAVGEDLLEPVLGGTVLARLSRRFGEGLVNGALTARVGVAAMEVCRPMGFGPGRRPKLRDIIRRSLAGFVPRTGS